MFPIRYLMAIMGSIGLAILYGFKVNASVAIVAMVNHTAVKLSASHSSEADNTTMMNTEVCQLEDVLNITKTANEDGPFIWDETLQGLILSSYFWGYMAFLLPGGRLAELWSASWVMNGSVLLNLIASLLTPIAVKTHHSLFAVVRFVQGIGGGVSFPAMHVMIAKWAPPNERSVIVSTVYAGKTVNYRTSRQNSRDMS